MRRSPLPTVLAPLVALALLAAVPAPASAAAAPRSVPAAAGVTAPAPTVDAAEAEVTALGLEFERTTAELTAGTVRYEAGEAELADTQSRAVQARSTAEEALAAAAAARVRLGRVVNAAYRSPRPERVTLALVALPGQLGEAAFGDAALDHVRGNQQEVLHEATAEGVRAQALKAEADQLEVQATAEAADLQAQLAALQSEAAATQVRLEAAAARLQAARAAEQARLAAVEAAARVAAGTASLADASGGGALCTGTSTVGFPNGFLPAEALCPLSVGNGHRLRADAAKAFNALAAAHPVCVTDSYRSYGAQVDVYGRKPGLAAIPGTSNHGLGLAVDFCGGVESFGTPAYLWMKANAPTYGFVHPAWAEPGSGRPEPWHWEFAG